MKSKKNSFILSLVFGFIASAIGIFILNYLIKSDFSKSVKIFGTLIPWAGIAYASIKLDFWKGMCIWLLSFTVIKGFLGEVPPLNIINETIRNLYFHVTMWFAMLFLLLASIIYSILYLIKEDLKWDAFAQGAAEAGTVMGFIGLVTGMIWAHFTWGKFWHGDPKQVYTAIGLLLYVAYFILRGAFTDEITRARLAAVINIFSFPSLIVLLYVLPRMMTSLHPGQEGNPAFSDYDLNDDMRVVFYPAIIGWTLLGVWIASLKIRTRLVEIKLLNR